MAPPQPPDPPAPDGPKPASALPLFAVVAGVVAVLGLVAVVVVLVGNRGEATPSSPAATMQAAGVALPDFPDSGPDPAVGRTAPVLEGVAFDGTPVGLRPGDGRAKAVVFVAHWCPHCQQEVPVLTEWLEAGKKPDDVDLLLVSTGASASRPNYPPQQWLATEGYPGPVLADPDGSPAADAYGLTAYPFWVFVRPDGTVAGRFPGVLDEARLDQAVAQLGGGS